MRKSLQLRLPFLLTPLSQTRRLPGRPGHWELLSAATRHDTMRSHGRHTRHLGGRCHMVETLPTRTPLYLMLERRLREVFMTEGHRTLRRCTRQRLRPRLQMSKTFRELQ